MPPFAKDFVVELLGRRGRGGAVVSVKRNRLEMQDDKEMIRYVEVTNEQPGWRYDLVILEATDPMAQILHDSRQPSPDEIVRQLDYAEQVLDAGFVNPALLVAWGALEATMRQSLQLVDYKVGSKAEPMAMNGELHASGVILTEDYEMVRAAWKLRNEIVHGFSPAPVDAETVTLLIRSARQLLEPSQVAEQPA